MFRFLITFVAELKIKSLPVVENIREDFDEVLKKIAEKVHPIGSHS